MKNNPLALICLFFCLGIWAAKYVHIPLVFIYGSCVLFLLTALVSLRRQPLFSLCLGLAIFLVGFLHFVNVQSYPANHIYNFASDEGQEVYLIGKAVSNPEVSQTIYHSKKTDFTFRVGDLKVRDKWQQVEGLIKVTSYGKRQVKYGDDLLLQGWLEQPPGMRNPGGFNYRAYLVNHNIFGTLKVKEKDIFLPIRGDSFPNGLRNGSRRALETVLRGVFEIKQRLHRIILRHLGPPQDALLSAILWYGI